MSSAANHKKRSCRSSIRQRATFGSIHRQAKYRSARVTYRKTLWQRLASLFRRKKEASL